MQATERAMREAALQLMREGGYEATSTDDIARAAGVSPRTFFNYFATKEDVVFITEDVVPGLVTRPFGHGRSARIWRRRWLPR